jgi:hypothetical protein
VFCVAERFVVAHFREGITPRWNLLATMLSSNAQEPVPRGDVFHSGPPNWFPWAPVAVLPCHQGAVLPEVIGIITEYERS